MRKYGDESPLHVIIFDEIDAICGKRGTDHSGTSKYIIIKVREMMLLISFSQTLMVLRL